MIKVWGKILSGEKIIKHKTLSIDETKLTFFDMLKQVCENLNIPTPVLLDKHVYDFNLFKFCTFKPDDFVEHVVFDKLIIEYIAN